MPNEIIATASKTIIDISDGGSLDVDINCNSPKTQIYDIKSGGYQPDWSSNGHSVVLTPIIYLGNRQIQLNDSNLTSVVWYKRDGDGIEEIVVSSNDETITNKVLTISSNTIADTESKVLTYIVRISYTDPITNSVINATDAVTFTLLENADIVHQVEVSGNQVFKLTGKSGNTKVYSPASVTLATYTKNTTVYEWEYLSSSNSYAHYPNSATPARSTLEVRPGDNIWNNGDTATIRVVARSTTNQDEYFYDTITLYKIEDAPVAFLTNENVTFSANKEGKITNGLTFTVNVVGYQGSAKVAPTMAASPLSSLPTGMTYTQTTSGDEEVFTFTIAPNATLGTDLETNGYIQFNVSYPIATALTLRWSKVNSGQDGESAVTFSIYAPNGSVFLNQEGSLVLATQAYKGTTAITSESASYKWYKYQSGWQEIEGATNSSYTVNGSDVLSTGTYKCEMTFEEKIYTDVYTLEDKSDSCQAVVESSKGAYIYNFDTTYTFLFCRVWQNGTEIDPLKSTNFVTVNPNSANTGDYIYYAFTPYGTQLRYYNGTVWTNVSNNDAHKHTLIYSWSKIDKDGNVSFLTNVTSKVIYVDKDVIDEESTFVCEVINNNKVIAVSQFTISFPNPKISYSNGENLLQGTSNSPKLLTFNANNPGFYVSKWINIADVKNNQYITLRCYIDATDAANNEPNSEEAEWYITLYGSNETGQYALGYQGTHISRGTEGWSTLTIKIPGGIISLRPALMRNIYSTTQSIYYHSLKMEYGTVPTPWSNYPGENLTEIKELIEKTQVTLDILLGNNGDLNSLLSETDEDKRNQGIVMAVSKTLWEQSGQQEVDSVANKISEICNRLEVSIGGFADIYQDDTSGTQAMSWLKYRAEEPALYIGRTNAGTSVLDVFQTKITEKSLQFLQGESVVAEINNNELIINKTMANNIFQLGGLRAEVDSDDSITWSWAT